MKKGLLIIAILLGLIIFKDIPGVLYILVDANTVYPSYNNNDLDYIAGAKIYNWTSSTAYSEVNDTSVSDILVNNIQYSTISNSNVSNFGSNGISLNVVLGNTTLVTNSYYSTTIILCYMNNVTINMNKVYTGTSYVDTFSNEANYTKAILSNNIDKFSYDSYPQNPTPNYCRAITYIYQPSKDGNVMNTRLTSSGSLGWWYIVGQKTEYIGVADGLTSNQVNNVINNALSESDLATANDIQSVNSAIEDLGTDIENMSDDIVNNQNQNTQDIMNNQNQNSQNEINSQQVCTSYDKTSIKEDGLLNMSGNIATNSNWGVTDYIKVQNGRIKVMEQYNYSDGSAYCFYDFNKNKIGCYALNTLVSDLTIPSNVVYMRSSIVKPSNKPQFQICVNGNQAMMDQDHNYNNNSSENLQGQQDLDNMTNAENSLMNDLDFSGVNNVNITINPNASNFIWQIVENLRNMNASIVLLFTSILGLGIIKLVLNR